MRSDHVPFRFGREGDPGDSDEAGVGMKVRITLSGCDDTTTIDTEVTSEQFDFLKSLVERSAAASEYGCQPRLYVVGRESDGQ